MLVADLLRSLPARDRQVIQIRFRGGLTQSEIGERIGVSQMQVSRIVRKSLAQLHALVTAHDHATPGHGPSDAHSNGRRPG